MATRDDFSKLVTDQLRPRKGLGVFDISPLRIQTPTFRQGVFSFKPKMPRMPRMPSAPKSPFMGKGLKQSRLVRDWTKPIGGF